VNRISRLIDQGTLRAGDRIPSIRKLSSKDGVSVSTVLQAYLVLESKGLIEAKPQSGFYVRLRRDLPAEPKPSNPSAAVTRVGVNELVLQVVHAASNPEMMNLGAGIPGLELLPIERLNRILGMLARRCDAAGINYDFLPGFESLRRQIAKRSLEWGCSLTADDIVTTNGAMEALNLSIRAVAKPGNIIALESPTFYGTLQVIESLGMKAVEIPMHPRDGIILDALESAIKKYRINACVVSANFSNPLGSCMPDKNKEALVKLLSHREIPLIEDDIYGDLHFGPSVPKRQKLTIDRDWFFSALRFQRRLHRVTASDGQPLVDSRQP
jgi:DNA-binding transcriptional MocR family regulator